jgi:hypothetical protein
MIFVFSSHDDESTEAVMESLRLALLTSVHLLSICHDVLPTDDATKTAYYEALCNICIAESIASSFKSYASRVCSNEIKID